MLPGMLTFSDRASWDQDLSSVLLQANLEEVPIVCIVPTAMLTEDPLTETTALQLVAQRRSEIEAGLRHQIEEGDFQRDGSVIYYPGHSP